MLTGPPRIISSSVGKLSAKKETVFAIIEIKKLLTLEYLNAILIKFDPLFRKWKIGISLENYDSFITHAIYDWQWVFFTAIKSLVL